MSSCKFTEFGLCVKTELLKRGLSQRWLEEEVTRKTGMFMDSGYMLKILTGRRNPKKIVRMICEILDIDDAETMQDGVVTRKTIVPDLDDLSHDLKCGVRNLIYIVEAAGSRGMDESVEDAFHACTNYLWRVQEQLESYVDCLYPAVRGQGNEE